MAKKIGFLGIGAMGSRMVERLLDAGFQVTVWNRTAARAGTLLKRGATVADTPRDAATGADVVMSMVRDDDASRDVWLTPETGAFAGMERRALAVECSTLTVPHVRVLGAEAATRGLRFVDAPLAGSRPQAEQGQLIFFAGGNPEDIDTAAPALAAMGSAVHRVGDIGAGATVKLAVNALLGVQVAAMGEVLGLIQRLEVDADRAVEVLGDVPVASPIAKVLAGMMLAGNFDPMFPVELLNKDLGYVVDAGDAPMSRAAKDVMTRAMASGLGQQNMTAVVKLYA